MFDQKIDWQARDAQLTTEPNYPRDPNAPSHKELVERFYNNKAMRDDHVDDAFGSFYENNSANDLVNELKKIGASMADGGEQVDATTIGNRVIDIVRRELKRCAIEYANLNYEE